MVLHTENGMLGMGPAAEPGHEDWDLTNAGKQAVTELPGAAYFHHADSFAMMRGGHLDVCVLGAFQVSVTGDLANWHTGAPDAIPAVGGAMDLAIGAKQVFVMMTLFAKDGTPKLVRECTYPLTGVACVTRLYTDLATFELGPDGVRLLTTYGVDAGELEERLGLACRWSRRPKPVWLRRLRSGLGLTGFRDGPALPSSNQRVRAWSPCRRATTCRTRRGARPSYPCLVPMSAPLVITWTRAMPWPRPRSWSSLSQARIGPALVEGSKPFSRARSMNWRGVRPVLSSMLSR